MAFTNSVFERLENSAERMGLRSYMKKKNGESGRLGALGSFAAFSFFTFPLAFGAAIAGWGASCFARVALYVTSSLSYFTFYVSVLAL